MEKNEVLDRLAAGRLTRRELHQAMAAAGLAAVAVPVWARPARADGAVTFFTWGGYDNPELHKAYVDKYGPPNYSILGEEEALQKMRAGFRPDLAHPCTYSIGRWRDSGLFQPIDVSRLANYPDV